MEDIVHPFESFAVTQQLHPERKPRESGHTRQESAAGDEVVKRCKEHSPRKVQELSAFVGGVSVLELFGNLLVSLFFLFLLLLFFLVFSLLEFLFFLGNKIVDSGNLGCLAHALCRRPGPRYEFRGSDRRLGSGGGFRVGGFGFGGLDVTSGNIRGAAATAAAAVVAAVAADGAASGYPRRCRSGERRV